MTHCPRCGKDNPAEIHTCSPKAEQEPVQNEFNRVINHAIEQGTEASSFLRCWREGDWEGCAEFGFEPNMAAYTAHQPRKWLTDEEIKAFAMEAFDSSWDADDETLVNKYGHGVYLWRFVDFARAIEAAVWGDGK